jgi:hypothetical protein
MTTIIGAGDPWAIAATDAVQHGDVAGLRPLLADHPELAAAAIGTAGAGRQQAHPATRGHGLARPLPDVAATIQASRRARTATPGSPARTPKPRCAGRPPATT